MPAYETTGRRAPRSLLKDMHLALLSEIGARAVYDHMRKRAGDDELAALLARLNLDGAESVARLQRLMRELGGRPRRTSFRRRALARALAWSSRVTGRRLVLRICMNAEETVSRWYGEYARFLARIGATEQARVCQELQQVKRAHAQALGAWVTNMARR